MAFEIAPKEVVAKKDAGEKLCLIDVREQFEWDICHIEGANLVPMNTVPQALQQLEAQLLAGATAGARVGFVNDDAFRGSGKKLFAVAFALDVIKAHHHDWVVIE